jgi:hypothetical protein
LQIVSAAPQTLCGPQQQFLGPERVKSALSLPLSTGNYWCNREATTPRLFSAIHPRWAVGRRIVPGRTVVSVQAICNTHQWMRGRARFARHQGRMRDERAGRDRRLQSTVPCLPRREFKRDAAADVSQPQHANSRDPCAARRLEIRGPDCPPAMSRETHNQPANQKNDVL